MGTRSLALVRPLGPPINHITFRTIDIKELRYAWPLCHGWIALGSTTRNVRRVELQCTRMLQIKGPTMETSLTQGMMGYDLRISCARTSNADMETGHHFALWVTR